MRFFSLLFTLALATTNAFGSVTVSVNGTNYTIPQTNEKGWGTNVTTWIQGISQYTLQPSGGTFTLTAEVDTGATYGFKTPYIKTETATPATAGVLRLAKADLIDWRNNANGANLPLGIDSSDRLTFNSVIIPTATAASVQDSTFTIYDDGDSTKKIAFQASGITGSTTRTITMPDANVNLGALTNSNLSGSAAITNANLNTMTANTVKANATGSTATPTDVGFVSTNTASTGVFRDSSGNFSAGTITAALTGTASGNTTYTPNQYGVVVSGSANVLGVISPVASTYKVLSSGGSSANPTWTLEGISTPTTGSTFGNVAAGGSLSGTGVTAIGVTAGAANSSGSNNTYLGYAAGSLVTTGASNTIIGSETGTATITTGGRNTIVGALITPGALNITDQVLIGNGVGAAALSSTGDVVIGSLAQGNSSNQTSNPTLAVVSIGYSANGNASYAANDSVTVGAFSSAGGVDDIILGSGVQSNSADTFVAGHGGNTVSTNYVTTTGANQITFGTSTKSLKDLYLGNGAVGIAAPANISIQPTPVLAGTSNTAGASFTLSGGNSTGTGAGGSIIFQTAAAGGSGTTVNTLANVGQITSTGAHTFGATSTAPAHILNGTLGYNGSSSGTVTVGASSGTYNFNWPTTAGTAGYALTSGGGGSTANTWTQIAAVGAYQTKTANYTLLNTDFFVIANTNAFTLTLPTAVGIPSQVFCMKKGTSDTNTITIATTSSQTIDGSSSGTANFALYFQYETLCVTSDNANWQVVKHYYPNKQYAVTASGPAGWATTRSVARIYVTQDLVWHAIINLEGTYTAATQPSVTMTNLTFYNGASQSLSGSCQSAAQVSNFSRTDSNTSTITFNTAANCSHLTVSGDVELNAKPGFAL